MHDVFSSVKGLLKLDSVIIDNNVFRLHYKATMFILVAFSIMITQKQYFGDPIDCITSEDGMDAEIMDSYCWIHGTYVLPDLYHPQGDPKKSHPGIGVDSDDHTHERKYHMYYQWVTLFLYLQAVMFYLPRYLWKVNEGQKMKQIVQEMDSPIVDEEKKDKKKGVLTDYFKNNLHKQEFYAYKYFGCEILNFVNVVGQMFLVNRFLGGEFTTYGTKVLNFSEEDRQMNRIDPMYIVFPRVTKCKMNTYGVGGSVQHHDALCVLPVNVINEKIFIFMWFWFVIIATISGLALVYRALCFLPQFRNLIIESRNKMVVSSDMNKVTKQCWIGDWFILYQLSKNMDPVIFKEFVTDLAVKFEELPANPSAPPSASVKYGTLTKAH